MTKLAIVSPNANEGNRRTTKTSAGRIRFMPKGLHKIWNLWSQNLRPVSHQKRSSNEIGVLFYYPNFMAKSSALR